MITCYDCDDTGEVDCGACGGDGYTWFLNEDGTEDDFKCDTCDGHGFVPCDCGVSS